MEKIKKNPDQIKNIFYLISFVSINSYILLIQFLVLQYLIVTENISIIAIFYSQNYFWFYLFPPILSLIFIIYCFVNKKGKIKNLYIQYCNKFKFILYIMNISIFLILILAAVLVSGYYLFYNNSNNYGTKLTLLYDSGSLNKPIVGSIVFPLAQSLNLKRNEIALLPLSEINIEIALQNSPNIIVLSHGKNGKLNSMNPYTKYSYQYFASIKNKKVKLIYFSACSLGVDDNQEKWNDAMFPAKVIIYKRNSAVIEHVIWIIFEAKMKIEIG